MQPTENLKNADLKTLMSRFETECIRNTSIRSKKHDIPRRLTQLRQTMTGWKNLYSTKQFQRWLLTIRKETEELYTLLQVYYEHDKNTSYIKNIIDALHEKCRSVYLEVADMTWSQVQISIFDSDQSMKKRGRSRSPQKSRRIKKSNLSELLHEFQMLGQSL